jgi:tetratricopeptide (TPR) repeat protein
MSITPAMLLITLLLLPVSAFGEIITIKHTIKQTFGGAKSREDARISAIAQAKREVLEKAATYLEPLIVAQRIKVEKNDIFALTAGILNAKVVSPESYASKDASDIEIFVNVVMDTSLLEERAKRFLQDRSHLMQLKETQEKEGELLRKVNQLEEENRQLLAKKQNTKKLIKEFQHASQQLMAVEWVYKASSLWDGNQYSDLKKAIGYLDNAIKLQADYAGAYNERGIAYAKLGHQQRAIEDYNKAILLKPDYAEAHYNRGVAYYNLGRHPLAIADFDQVIRLQPNHVLAYYMRGVASADLGRQQRAIEDYNKAILLKPDYADAYYNRGVAYYNLARYQGAIEEFNEAIRLQPHLTNAYVNRGAAHAKLGQYQLAIENYNEAIRPQPYFAEAYYNRGVAYYKLGQEQLAIEDFNQVIRLQPNHILAYSMRGDAYFLQNSNNLGCPDAQKACALGNCKLLEMAKSKGNCH